MYMPTYPTYTLLSPPIPTCSTTCMYLPTIHCTPISIGKFPTSQPTELKTVPS